MISGMFTGTCRDAECYGCRHCIAADSPCCFPPGTKQKLAWMTVRQSRGEFLFQPFDADNTAWQPLLAAGLIHYEDRLHQPGLSAEEARRRAYLAKKRKQFAALGPLDDDLEGDDDDLVDGE